MIKKTIFSTSTEFVCCNSEEEVKEKNNCDNCDCRSLILFDERINLNKTLDNKVIAIASLGLWNGRKSGYKILTNNLNSIFDIAEDEFEVYSDGNDVRGTYHHHDGTKYIKFRLLREGNVERFLNAVYNQEVISPRMLSRYTSSILPYVNDIYGW